MAITDRQIDQVFDELKPTFGGLREDYFALLYLEQEFGLEREKVAAQTAFGGNDFGIDAFHVDERKGNLYLFQFKWTSSANQFKNSFQRLIDSGMERIFGVSEQVQEQNQLLMQLRHKLLEDKAIINTVFFHFVFNGDIAEAERSQTLDKLREDLEAKKYLIDQLFGRPLSMAIEYRSARTAKVGGFVHKRITHTYPLDLKGEVKWKGPNGEMMVVGFAKLLDFEAMYREMGLQFFERNIRAGLGEEEAPNREIAKSLKRVLEGSEDPTLFGFNHNGITLFAERLEKQEGTNHNITEPRVLNGAQTITTLGRFLKKNEGNQRLTEGRLGGVRVLCRIITEARPDFVLSVTINNNRQNPILPWNLHANDMIQLELQDKFRNDLGIYYERQENAFANLSQDALDELEITQYKAIEMLRLTKTFLVSDGEIDKLQRLREVFENDRLYDHVFSSARLRADSRQVVLCYKAQFRLRRLHEEMLERGANKYAFLSRGRNLLWALLCQAMLNDEKVATQAENFGKSMVIEADYTRWLATLASTRVRYLIKEAIKREPYSKMIEDGRFDFLRSRAFFETCMDVSHSRWRWVQKKLK